MRPGPRFPEPDTQPFWEATRERRFIYQVCPDTGKPVFYPRRHSPYTGVLLTEWRESRGEGTIYSYSVVRSNRHPSFKDLGAYAVALVDLDEGFRMLTGIVGVDDPVNDLAIGQRVKLTWEDLEDGYAVPLFTPA
jgi:uncharacterized OB-fold protein